MKTEKNTAIFKEYANFFASREFALHQCRSFSDWMDHEEREWALQYDFLFRGTDGDFHPPLWASVSKGENALLNQTTLEVIHFYHRWGYEPLWLEGNPPDYIGEQLNFLGYLWDATGYEEEKEIILSGMECFIQEYTLYTAELLWKCVAQYTDVFSGMVEYVRKLVVFLSEEDIGSMFVDHGVMNSTKLHTPITNEEVKVIPTAGINNCGGICVIRPKVQENCMIEIESDCDSSAPQLRACVRGRAYRKTFLHSDRLRYPMKRIGKRGSGKFERISWEEAVSILSKQWIRIRDSYGPGSRFFLYGTGVTGVMHPGKLARRLAAMDGGYLDYFNSYSSACVNYITPYIFGTNDCGNSPVDMLHTKLLILWADNTAESIFGSERNYYLSILKEQGVRIIVIDPRLSQTGITYGDEWFALRPSTDAALADAMAYVIWSEGLQNQEFMDQFCIGFDEEHMPEGVPTGESYYSYLFGMADGIIKNPEWAEKITGIDKERIRKLAREYATTKPACISTGFGAQRHGNGEQSAKGICMLACLTGNIGISGGGTGGNGSNIKEHEGIQFISDSGMNPYPGKIPTFLWTKAIEEGTEMTPRKDRVKGVERLDSNIKMLFQLASNTLINQHSNINDTIRILEDETKCEFIVCSDIFMTSSVRYADLILPATSVFEGENIVNPWSGSNYLLKNNQVIRPFFECRFEWDWLKEIANELGCYNEFVEHKPELNQWLKHCYNMLREKEPELPEYESFSNAGGWQYKDQIHSIAFEKQIADPDNHPFQTPSGKIEIFSKTLYEFGQIEDIPAIPKYVPCKEGPEDPMNSKYPLQLIGWHTRRRAHSIHDNNEWMEEVEQPGVWIHPEDAKLRQIENKELVEIKNDRGKVRIPAIVTNRIRQGVVAISQGGWYTPNSEGTDLRGCINVLTSSEHPTPLAKGNPQHTNLVDVGKILEK